MPRDRSIEKPPRTGAFDPKWALPSLICSNPLVWMPQVNGVLVDLRTMPGEDQELAFAKEIIPYIPQIGKSIVTHGLGAPGMLGRSAPARCQRWSATKLDR